MVTCQVTLINDQPNTFFPSIRFNLTVCSCMFALKDVCLMFMYLGSFLFTVNFEQVSHVGSSCIVLCVFSSDLAKA